MSDPLLEKIHASGVKALVETRQVETPLQDASHPHPPPLDQPDGSFFDCPLDDIHRRGIDSMLAHSDE